VELPGCDRKGRRADASRLGLVRGKGALFSAIFELVTAVFLVSVAAASSRAQEDSAISTRIHAALVSGGEGSTTAARRYLRRTDLAAQFYASRQFRPAWTDGHRFLPYALELLRALHGAATQGLRPEEYHLQDLWDGSRDAESQGPLDPETWAWQDVLLTDAFLTLGDHLLRGRVDSGEVDVEWESETRRTDLTEVLGEALAACRVREALEALAPSDPGYQGLREALVRYRAIAASGGWEALGQLPTLHPRDRSPAVYSLRRRLCAEGYLLSAAGPPVMDEALVLAVQAYQARNGLAPDGVVGCTTRAALDVPAAARTAQIEASLERWRWRGPVRATRHLRVNIPAFRMEAVEQGRSVLEMAVVVGTPENPTPVFSGRMTHLVLNPSWNVPPAIAREEFLPQLRRDPLHFAKRGFQVLRGWSPEAAVNPESVDWTAASLDRDGLHFRQNPGPENALGRIKFLFPNRFHVYLHDTPARGLFTKARRDFSHGCIRVAEPVRLAEYLLARDRRWDATSLQEALAQGEERTVLLTEPVLVRVEYITAWADESGAVNFRADIYGQDERLVERLRGGGPAARLAASGEERPEDPGLQAALTPKPTAPRRGQ
jgi:murein L,D-transpeptidase YcbB/YkuD